MILNINLMLLSFSNVISALSMPSLFLHAGYYIDFLGNL